MVNGKIDHIRTG